MQQTTQIALNSKKRKANYLNEMLTDTNPSELLETVVNYF